MNVPTKGSAEADGKFARYNLGGDLNGHGQTLLNRRCLKDAFARSSIAAAVPFDIRIDHLIDQVLE